MSAADDGARVATPDTERKGTPPSVRRGCLDALGLLFAHAWMTFNVAVVFGVLVAFVHAILPPYALLAMLGWALDYWRLSLPAMLIWMVLLAGLWRVAGPTFLHRPIAWGISLPVLLLWMPLLSAEFVRSSAMGLSLRTARSQCHDTRNILESTQGRIDGFAIRSPHAWMIKDGQRYLWSYRTMAFEPDPRPLAWGPVCRP